MTKQLFLSGIEGFVVYFLLGWLAYGILFTEETTGEESTLFIALGCLFYTFIYATIFTRWANISTFSTGLKAGAILGLLYQLSWEFFMTTGAIDVLPFLKSLIINVLMTALMAGVVAYVNGKTS